MSVHQRMSDSPKVEQAGCSQSNPSSNPVILTSNCADSADFDVKKTGKLRRSDQSGGEKHRVALAAELAAIIAVPVVLIACAASGFEQTALLSFAVVLVSLGVFFAGFEGARPRMRDIMPVVVLAALAAAGRILFAPFPDFKPVSAIAIIAGVAFGRRSGFMVGALAALASNFFFGQGPWTPWQMYAWGLVGYLAGVLAQTGLFSGAIVRKKPRIEAAVRSRSPLGTDMCNRAESGMRAHSDESMCNRSKENACNDVGEKTALSRLRSAVAAAPLYIYGFVSGPLYGVILNLWSIVGFYHPQDALQFALVYAAALPFDIMHGVATVVFLLALYAPWHRKLERVKRKYGISGRADLREES